MVLRSAPIISTTTRPLTDLKPATGFTFRILKSLAADPMHFAQHRKAGNKHKEKRYNFKYHRLQPELRKGGTLFN